MALLFRISPKSIINIFFIIIFSSKFKALFIFIAPANDKPAPPKGPPGMPVGSGQRAPQAGEISKEGTPISTASGGGQGSFAGTPSGGKGSFGSRSGGRGCKYPILIYFVDSNQICTHKTESNVFFHDIYSIW